ncbi:branched-chain amino acid ABC transporter permease [Ramlibacter sp.]|uniref:branched-chain amino acid ABC transporter permease n=1 Tax=Ramlibacter sp. TaxID=1917967 RepID=UPI003D0A4556
MQLAVTQIVNGLVLGMLLFLMSAGLSLIFGLMNVVNLAHGSFFMLGAFFALSIVNWTGSFFAGLALGWIPAVVLGFAMERLFIRYLYSRTHLDQVLLTFGFTFVISDLVRMAWGPEIRNIAVPQMLEGAFEIFGVIVPKYRLFLIAFGGAIAVLLWLFLERSRVGAMVRAGVDDAAVASGLGVNVQLLFGAIFALGVGLAALGGAAAGPVLGVYTGIDFEILIPAFIVVVIGGMGSLRGAFVSSMFVGVVDTLGKAYFPDLALFAVYFLMVVVLLTRPQGLFGVSKA